MKERVFQILDSRLTSVPLCSFISWFYLDKNAKKVQGNHNFDTFYARKSPELNKAIFVSQGTFQSIYYRAAERRRDEKEAQPGTKPFWMPELLHQEVKSK